MKKVVALLLVLTCMVGIVSSAFALSPYKAGRAPYAQSAAAIKAAEAAARKQAQNNLKRGNMQAYANYTLQANTLSVMWHNQADWEARHK